MAGKRGEEEEEEEEEKEKEGCNVVFISVSAIRVL